MTNRIRLFTALLLATCAMSAFAQQQEPGKPDTIVLTDKTGSVMTSNGGDYQSAGAGKVLVDGESMMLMDGAKATVVYTYDNGKRKCTETYKGPNTYVIDDNCTKAAAMAGNNKGTIAIVAGAVLVGAALSGGGGSSDIVQPPPPPPPPPVSGN